MALQSSGRGTCLPLMPGMASSGMPLSRTWRKERSHCLSDEHNSMMINPDLEVCFLFADGFVRLADGIEVVRGPPCCCWGGHLLQRSGAEWKGSCD